MMTTYHAHRGHCREEGSARVLITTANYADATSLSFVMAWAECGNEFGAHAFDVLLGRHFDVRK